jgi:hypothetical protein
MIFAMEEYEYNSVINALVRHVQGLTIELSAVLCDVCRYLPAEAAGEVRRMTADDFSYRLRMDSDYQSYVQQECGGVDPLFDSDFSEEIYSCLWDEDDDLFYPSYYDRKELLH